MGQLTFEGSAINDELLNQGFTLLDHHIPNEAVDELIAAYAKFTDNLPDPDLETVAALVKDPDKLDELDYGQDTKKEWHKYRTNHPFVFKPGGYTNRSLQVKAVREILGLEVEDDPKEYYHFLPSSTVRMNAQRDRFGWGPLPPEVYDLNKRFAPIHALGAKAITGLMQNVEDKFPELISKVMTPKDLEASPLRLLFYHPAQGDLLAGGHYDKTIFTAQLAESHEGLRLRNPSNGEMQEVTRPPEKAVAFAGSLLTLPHVYPDSEIKPGWHDALNKEVLNEGRSLIGKNVVRWALVFFANSGFAGEIGKDITHVETSELVA